MWCRIQECAQEEINSLSVVFMLHSYSVVRMSKAGGIFIQRFCQPFEKVIIIIRKRKKVPTHVYVYVYIDYENQLYQLYTRTWIGNEIGWKYTHTTLLQLAQFLIRSANLLYYEFFKHFYFYICLSIVELIWFFNELFAIK